MTIAHIFNGELGFDVRTKLNALIDLAGGAIAPFTTGSVLFADLSGNLAQNNANFFWNDTLKDLHIGGAYYVNTAKALFVVPNITRNNWFEGASGNLTVSGYGNFGTGDLALAAITSGYDNVALGANAGRQLTSGSQNFALGSLSLLCSQSDINNIAIGSTALQQLGNAGAGGGGNETNVAIGFGSMNQVEQAAGNIAIGSATMAGVLPPTTANFNTIIGHNAGAGLGSGGGASVAYNTLIGKNAGRLLTGASGYNVWLGPFEGLSATMTNTAAVSSTYCMLDYHVTGPFTWSIASMPGLGIPPGLQIYNTITALGNMGSNYERAVLDWCSSSYTAANMFIIDTQRGGTGVKRNIVIGVFPKAGAPAASDLLPGTFSVIDDTSANKTWLAFNKAGTIRQTEIGGAGGGGGMSIGGAITSATAGSVLFAGASGVLAQDNTNFFWDDTLKDLHIGGAYYVAAARALYVVTPVSGDRNWFEGNAGNQTMSGYGNFGTGDLALSSLTSGSNNVALGASAGKFLTTANDNFAMGSYALWFGQADSGNIAIGRLAMATLGISGTGGGGNGQNIALGYAAFSNAAQGNNNVVIGYTALNNVAAPTISSFNTIIGSGAGNNLGIGGGASVDLNTLIGSSSGLNLTGASVQNVWVGGYRGPSATVGRTIALSDGGGTTGLLDWHLTTFQTWSFHAGGNGVPAGLHIYNVQSPAFSTSNYERAILDWNPTANVFRIASQKGGSGTVRLIAIDGFTKAGAPAAGDLPASSFAVIDDTSAGQTWLVFNKAGTIRKVQLT